MLSTQTRASTGAAKAAARNISRELAGKPTTPKNPLQQEAFSDRDTGSSNAHGVARDQLRAFIERIERLEEEKQTIADDIKDVYGEAKSMGYDTKIMKKVVGLRKKDDQERMEEDLILDTYLSALGMIPGAAEDDDA